jgi:hypothetical protein
VGQEHSNGRADPPGALLIKHDVLSKLMSNKKTIAILFTSMAVLLGATMIANPIALVNAQGNQSQGNQSQGNKTNATGEQRH